MPALLSILLQAARDASAARDAASAAAAAASRVARRPVAASRSARSVAAAARSTVAAASRASIAVRQACMYAEEEEEEEKEERHKSRSRGRSLPAYVIDDPVPGKDVTDKDLESDDLYERWCKAYNKERDHGEMARRFNVSAVSVYYRNKGFRDDPQGQVYLGKFADGINAQERG